MCGSIGRRCPMTGVFVYAIIYGNVPDGGLYTQLTCYTIDENNFYLALIDICMPCGVYHQYWIIILDMTVLYWVYQRFPGMG